MEQPINKKGLTFCTFNILADYAVKYHTENCTDFEGMDNDNDFRYGIIINILLKNDYDIIFLQEVGTTFYKLESYKNLLDNYFIQIKNDLCICLKKLHFKDCAKPDVSIIDKYTFGTEYNIKSETVLKQILYVKGTLNNGETIHFINTHLLPGSKTSDEILTDDIRSAKMLINQYMIQLKMNNNIIISGDMNTEISLEFNNLIKIFSSMQTTSVSLKTCGIKQNIFKDFNYKELDHIYVSKNIKVRKSIQYDDFDKQTYDIKWAGTFYNYVPPYIPSNTDNIKKQWVFKKYKDMYDSIEQNKKWPSDHLLLTFNIIFEDLKVTSQEFIPKQPQNSYIPYLQPQTSYNPYSQTQYPQHTYNPYLQPQYPNITPMGKQFGGTDINYYEKYKKYKSKYLNIKNIDF